MAGEKRGGTGGRATARLALAGVAAGAAVARRVMAPDPHVVRVSGGLALVYNVRRGLDEPVRVLRTGGVYQSATYLGVRRMEPVFAYYRAFGRLFDLRPATRRVLVVGGGGFAFPKLVASEHPGVRTDVVEIDPAVIRAARRWFFLDEAVARARAGGGDLRVVCDDGRRFLEGCDVPYDAVVLDAFVGAEPVYSLATVDALRAAHRALAPGGVLAANVVSRDGGADVGFLRSVVATARMAFSEVAIVPCTDDAHAAEDNYLVLASDAPLELPDAIGYDADFLGEVLFD